MAGGLRWPRTKLATELAFSLYAYSGRGNVAPQPIAPKPVLADTGPKASAVGHEGSVLCAYVARESR
jgi:hypothetical protein